MHKHAEPDPTMETLTERCIGCMLCTHMAPSHFGYDVQTDSSCVRRQPASAAERKLCRAAMQNCPMEAIHCNGKSKSRTEIQSGGKP